ncbi:MAG: hypothetical protein ABI986_09370 [Chloroflexota bacterium]
MIVIQRLEETGKIAVDDIQRQHGFIDPQRTAGKILPEAQYDSNEQNKHDYIIFSDELQRLGFHD